MPRGGARRGAGRKKGSLERRHKVYVENPGELLPIDWMLAVLRDPDVEQQRKDRMAEVAAPYMHAKLSAIEVNRTGRVNQETINVVQIFAVPRGGSLDINAGVITVDGSPLEPMSIEPFEPTPGLVIEDQTMVREPPEPLPVIEVDEAANVTPLSSWRKRDE